MNFPFVQILGSYFLKTVEISLHASLIIGVLLVIRPVIKRLLPPRWVYALWFIVVARLLLVDVPSLPAAASPPLQSSLAVVQSINLEDSLPRAAGMPEREAMNHLGHESRAIHAAYAGGATVATLPLEFYEAQRREKVLQFTAAA